MLVNKVKKAAPSHEVQEQESGTYIFPSETEFKYGWIMWLYPDGSADIYTKRDGRNGAILGKPIRLAAPERKK
jgi:hypothetical protein